MAGHILSACVNCRDRRLPVFMEYALHAAVEFWTVVMMPLAIVNSHFGLSFLSNLTTPVKRSSAWPLWVKHPSCPCRNHFKFTGFVSVVKEFDITAPRKLIENDVRKPLLSRVPMDIVIRAGHFVSENNLVVLFRPRGA